MMETLTHWLRGPLFWAALAFALLGLLRHVLVTAWEARRIMARAGDRAFAWRRIARNTLGWLVPFGKVREQYLFAATSVLFHAGVILVPLFLAGHVALLRDAVGLGWPALPNAVATTLTIVALLAAAGLVVQRLLSAAARALTRPRDVLLTLVVALPFATGLLLMHPYWSPLPHEIAYFLHVLTADVVLLLTPVTRLSHMALLPFTQLVSETAWHFPPDAGARVEIALGKVGEPV